MSKLTMVTGATGALGRQVIEFLLEQVSAEHVAALARDPHKLSGLAQLGVSVRSGDYQDPESLRGAFDGVEKLLLVSAAAFTDVKSQHQNVIDAAKAAGVAHILYTAIQHPIGSTFEIPQVTEWDEYTENALQASGLEVTILHNSQYLDSFDDLIGEVPADGVIRVPAGDAPTALATRRDMAAATAAILASDGHASHDYTLAGSAAFTVDDLATILGAIQGRPVSYEDTAVDEYVRARVDAGMPEPYARFTAAWFQATAAGEFTPSDDIERLLGGPTASLRTFLTERRSSCRASERSAADASCSRDDRGALARAD